MNRTELEELIRNGENSGVEFKRDDVIPERLAKELAALLSNARKIAISRVWPTRCTNLFSRIAA